MSDKPVAALVAAVAVAPLCAVCVLGPASVLAAVTAWLGDGQTMLTVALVLGAGALVARAAARRRRAGPVPTPERSARERIEKVRS